MMDPRTFELTEEHVKLLRAASVSWNPAEWGAPTIDPKRPYGNGDIRRDMYRILDDDGTGWDDDHDMPARLAPREWNELSGKYGALHADTAAALQIVLATGLFEPGTYTAEKFRDWKRVDAGG